MAVEPLRTMQSEELPTRTRAPIPPHERYEFLSDAWLESARKHLEERVAEDPKAIAGQRWSMCEQYANAPPHLRFPDDLAVVHVEIDDGCVRAGKELAFGDGPVPGADLTVALDIDRYNFEELAAGTAIGWTRRGSGWPLEAKAGGEREAEGDLSHEFFEAVDGRIVARRPLMPIMMTTNRDNALADCLFYIVAEGRPVERAGRRGEDK